MEKESAAKYIPHRPPFVMVDEIISCDSTKCTTLFTIKNDNVLVENGCFIEGGIIENIAQSCAARIGYIQTHFKQDDQIKIGVIASIKNLEIERLPKIGEILETHIEETMSGFFNMSVLKSGVFCHKELLATCEIRVALTDKNSQ